MTQPSPQDDQGLSELPSPSTQRWDTKRKAQVVEAVRSGRLTIGSACDIYSMSIDEFLTWQSLFDKFGTKGLMATRVKKYRDQRIHRSTRKSAIDGLRKV